MGDSKSNAHSEEAWALAQRQLRRDQTHTASGLTTLRFTHRQVRCEPRRVRSVLAATSNRLAG